MKRTVVFLVISFLPVLSFAQEQEIDERAVVILDRMSSVIGDLTSCSFTLNVSFDVPDNTFFVPIDGIGLVKHFGVHEVAFSGPDNLLVQSRGDKGHRGYWYNGKVFSYYSYDENNYALLDAPGRTVDIMYQLNEDFGIEFPAADFFNPYFTDDLLDYSDRVLFLRTTMVEGQECFHIIARGPDRIVQLWIANDGMTLPVKMAIVYLDKEENPQYEATFSDWRINPELPPAMFNFTPPPAARKLLLVSKAEE